METIGSREVEMAVPFQDVLATYTELREELDDAYRRFMESGRYVLGDEVALFEEDYARYCDARYCVGVGSGLDALQLALRACGVGPGCEVIVPSNTYIATWLAVTQVGATVVPVEPSLETFNIDPARIEAAITERTRVILPVNLYGQPVDYGAIQQIAAARSLLVVVDNAQAHGARVNGRRVGGIADIECHSFYPTKNLGAFGEAGAITTNNPEFADRVQLLRNYGSRERYRHEVLGFNSRLDTLQAAFLRVKLRHLDRWNVRRAEIARLYLSRWKPNAGHSSRLIAPVVPGWADPVWHLFVVRHPDRDALHYPVAPHMSGAYKSYFKGRTSFPIAEQLASSILSLPLYPHLGEGAAAEVVEAVLQAVATLD
jgi:dTDP-4-amino-4,6-dideoxygalactose transaminase